MRSTIGISLRLSLLAVALALPTTGFAQSEKEAAQDLANEAARAFAMAAADLKAASDSVDRVLDRYSDQLDEQAMGRIQSNLSDSMGNYERAQQQLFDVLSMEEMP